MADTELPMYEPKIIAFLCTWCSYTGADLAGTSRFKSPHNIRAIRVPCSGRVSPELVMKAFDQGADGVLVLGCHIGECHYDTGNHRAAKRMPLLHDLMSFVGLEPQRLRLDWVSASEGERFARLVRGFVDDLRVLGPAKWRVLGGQLAETRPHLPISRHQWQPISYRLMADETLNVDHFSDIEGLIQKKANELLSSDDVSCVIGYEIGPRGRTRPAFIYNPDDVERLVWNQTCTHNLTTYLKQKLSMDSGQPPYAQPRVAVIVKPCDSKSINVLLAENRFKREQVHIIGVACDGVVEGAGFGKADGHYQQRCLSCSDRTPVVADTMIGEAPVVEDITPMDSAISRLEGLSVSQRMDFWLSQFDRCIRCYACRQACPVCDCPTCLYERDDSLWTGMNLEINEKRSFHLGRAYHLAGRCVGCNECERVCPMDIPISLLNVKLAQEVMDAYGYQAGMTVALSPITTPLAEEAKA
jgi:coenzyme F420-reducing hydrogenase delta subunit/ferredoxin